MNQDNNDNKTPTGNIVTAGSGDLSRSAPLASEGMMRREWLKNVMIGGVGLGLLGIPMPSLAAEQGDMKCPKIIRVSKDLKAEIYRYFCKHCLCGKDRVFSVTFDFKGLLYGNKACDESLKMIPDRSIVKGSLKYTLRSAICPETRKQLLLGCHEGKLFLYSPSRSSLFGATLYGTQGVNPDKSSAERCCWPYAEGALRARGTEEMTGCAICSSYHLKVPFNQFDPCTKTPPKELYMQFDGSLMCPC